MGKLYKENWYQKWQKKQIWTISRTCTGIGTGVYWYRYRGVLVHPTRGQHVSVQVQPVQVQANRMQHVPVQVQGVPV